MPIVLFWYLAPFQYLYESDTFGLGLGGRSYEPTFGKFHQFDR